MESGESSVKESSYDELHSLGAIFSPAVECAEEKVKANDQGFVEIPYTPHLPKSGMDSAFAYEPISSHTRCQEGQQSTIGCVTEEQSHESDDTKQSKSSSIDQMQDNPRWFGRDTKKDTIFRKPLNRSKCVILGRDFLLINLNLQPSLETDESFQFFHRASVSAVDVCARSNIFQEPMTCDLEVLSPDPNISTSIEIESMTSCEPFLQSIGLQSPQYSNVGPIGFHIPSQDSNILKSPSRIENHLVHQGLVARNLRTKRIMAFGLNDSRDVGHHVASSTDCKIRNFRCKWNRVVKNANFDNGCHHMAGQPKHDSSAKTKTQGS